MGCEAGECNKTSTPEGIFSGVKKKMKCKKESEVFFIYLYFYKVLVKEFIFL